MAKRCGEGRTISDGRPNRKAKVIPFVDRQERDRNENFQTLADKTNEVGKI